ncbi:hypothetical protein [Zobellella endophytica]|uniref:hypothetical protein n=1 Tax=Zobellella endophytica TaxID=2116700 RepID=UPI0011B252F3|nr:hypothetical protein [Zobellella endophytica]
MVDTEEAVSRIGWALILPVERRRPAFLRAWREPSDWPPAPDSRRQQVLSGMAVFHHNHHLAFMFTSTSSLFPWMIWFK